MIDTPPLVEGDCVDESAVAALSEFVGDLEDGVDVVAYVDRLDNYRCDARDRECCQAITRAFGGRVWERTVLALTRGQYTVPMEGELRLPGEALRALAGCARGAGAPARAALLAVPCGAAAAARQPGGER